VGHEVPGHPVIRVIKQDFHNFFQSIGVTARVQAKPEITLRAIVFKITGRKETGIIVPDTVGGEFFGSSIPVMCVGVHSQKPHIRM